MANAPVTAISRGTRSICKTAGSVLLVCGLAPLGAQSPQSSQIPPSAPTSSVSPSQLPSANPPVAPAVRPEENVLWDGSTLQISATNVGLNRLLRDIAGKTSLQLTGSAPDEQIFGTYGPGKLEDVLSDLLDGVPVNMVFVDRIGSGPKQLILTARAGGPSLPSPSQNRQESYSEPVRNAPPPFETSQGQLGQPVAPQPLPTSGANNGESPTGVRTPQQIFEQLQRLRQQANGQK